MIIPIIILVVWLAIGSAFGWGRAKQRYEESLDEYPILKTSGDWEVKLGAYAIAAWTLFLWSLLGVLAGIGIVILHYASSSRKIRKRK